MNDPVVPQKAPYAVEVEAGKDYFWCSCGRSASQPFCDGSHKGTGFVPLKFTPQSSGTVHFCGCKQSNRPPFCDGTHSKL
jgi:CDGSH iron-sulfur domain-containing protein 3